MVEKEFSRRAYLSSAAVTGTVLLAGCQGKSGNKETTSSSSNTSNTKTSQKAKAEKTETTATTTDQQTTAAKKNIKSNDIGTYSPMSKQAATFANIDAWEPDNGVKLTPETNNVYQGSQSGLVSKGGTIRRDFPVPIDLSKKDVSIAINVLQPRPTNVVIWLKDTNRNWLKFVQQINAPPVHPKGWLRINPSIESATKSNFKMESMLISVGGAKGTAPKYLVDDVRFHEKMVDKAKMLFTFDDASTNLYSDVVPILEEYGFKGALAVPSDVIGDNGRMTQSELKELQKKGWEICSHSTDFETLAGKPASVQQKKLKTAKEHLKQRGFGEIETLMYPGGQVDQATLKYAKKYYKYAFLAFTTAEKGSSISTFYNPAFINRAHPDTPEDILNQLKQVIAYNGIYSMYMHGVDKGERFPNTPSELRQICEQVKQYEKQGKVDVVTPNQLPLPK